MAKGRRNSQNRKKIVLVTSKATRTLARRFAKGKHPKGLLGETKVEAWLLTHVLAAKTEREQVELDGIRNALAERSRLVEVWVGLSRVESGVVNSGSTSSEEHGQIPPHQVQPELSGSNHTSEPPGLYGEGGFMSLFNEVTVERCSSGFGAYPFGQGPQAGGSIRPSEELEVVEVERTIGLQIPIPDARDQIHTDGFSAHGQPDVEDIPRTRFSKGGLNVPIPGLSDCAAQKASEPPLGFDETAHVHYETPPNQIRLEDRSERSIKQEYGGRFDDMHTGPAEFVDQWHARPQLQQVPRMREGPNVEGSFVLVGNARVRGIDEDVLDGDGDVVMHTDEDVEELVGDEPVAGCMTLEEAVFEETKRRDRLEEEERERRWLEEEIRRLEEEASDELLDEDEEQQRLEEEARRRIEDEKINRWLEEEIRRLEEGASGELLDEDEEHQHMEDEARPSVEDEDYSRWLEDIRQLEEAAGEPSHEEDQESLQAELLARLNRFRYGSSDEQERTPLPEEQESARLPENEERSLMLREHLFHRACLFEWLRQREMEGQAQAQLMEEQARARLIVEQAQAQLFLWFRQKEMEKQNRRALEENRRVLEEENRQFRQARFFEWLRQVQMEEEERWVKVEEEGLMGSAIGLYPRTEDAVEGTEKGSSKRRRSHQKMDTDEELRRARRVREDRNLRRTLARQEREERLERQVDRVASGSTVESGSGRWTRQKRARKN